MSIYIINVENTAGEEGTILADVGFNYTDKLNDINEANIKISGTGTVIRGLMEEGSKVEIKKDGTRDFYGIIDSINSLDAGGLVFHTSGFEIRLADENGAYANSPWSSTASATIAAAIIAESNYFTAGTIEAGTDLDFRLALTESLWNGLGNLTKKSQQDIGIDYANTEVDILDHKGSSTSVATLNDGIQIDNLRVNTGRPLGNYVIVYGKGDGENQIKSDSGHGQDAGSQGTYGVIKRPVIDRSCVSVAEANKLADAEVALTKDPTKIYDFNVKNTNLAVVSGDHLTLNSTEKDLDSAEVRVVAIERGMRGGREYLTIQVTNPAYKQLVKARNSILARLKKQQRDADSYMQGSTITNTWGGGINSKTNYALKVGFYVSPTFQDEAGNLNVNTLTVDYDVDKFKSNIGTASFTGSDPQVQNTSGNTQPGVSGSSSNTQPGVSGNAGSNNAGVSGTSSGTTPTAIGVAAYSNTDTNTTYTARAYIIGLFVGGSTYSGSNGVAYAKNNTGAAVTVDMYFKFPNAATGWQEGNQSLGNGVARRYAVSGIDTDYETGWFYCRDDNYVATHWWGYQTNEYEHSHGSHTHADGSYGADSHLHSDGTLIAANHLHADGSYTAADHSHPDGAYDINAADINHISVGDGVSESGSLNSSSVNLYLDKWNTGTSTWDNKHSVLATGKTLDNDVDLSDSGTYPDATGFWRVRAEPITATADFIQAIVRLKMHIDS